ncbi:hypothetical protein PM082_009162 [Marasmius tenuissimus]|nr:hypothetical protein PM082_009162 [Marasmius tenuissimus]
MLKDGEVGTDIQPEQKSRASTMHESDKRTQELGYKPESRREISLFSILGVSSCSIGILISSSAVQIGLLSGGPMGFLQAYTLEGSETPVHVAEEAKR